MTLDVKKNTRGRKNSDILATAYGTVDEEFTKDFIEKSFPYVLISEIAKEVKSISGIGNEQKVEKFRNGREPDGGGSEDDVHLDEGSQDTGE